jgi:hypothetical protein
MFKRLSIFAALLMLLAGSAYAGRACPSDAVTGAGSCCDKAPHATHTATAAHATDCAPAAPTASAHVTAAAAKPVSHQPQRSAVAPAFGPLFLAHQALML